MRTPSAGLASPVWRSSSFSTRFSNADTTSCRRWTWLSMTPILPSKEPGKESLTGAKGRLAVFGEGGRGLRDIAKRKKLGEQLRNLKFRSSTVGQGTTDQLRPAPLLCVHARGWQLSNISGRIWRDFQGTRLELSSGAPEARLTGAVNRDEPPGLLLRSAAEVYVARSSYVHSMYSTTICKDFACLSACAFPDATGTFASQVARRKPLVLMTILKPKCKKI